MSAWVEELQEQDDIYSQSAVTWSNRRQRPPLKQWPLQTAVNKFNTEVWQFWPIKVQSMRFGTWHAQGRISYCICATSSYLMNLHKRKKNAVFPLLFSSSTIYFWVKIGFNWVFGDRRSPMFHSCWVLFYYFVLLCLRGRRTWNTAKPTGYRTSASTRQAGKVDERWRKESLVFQSGTAAIGWPQPAVTMVTQLASSQHLHSLWNSLSTGDRRKRNMKYVSSHPHCYPP